MTYENITLRKPNVTMIDGYFYMMDNEQSALIVKTDDGTQAYSYPLDVALDSEDEWKILSMEYDGRNFWTLQDPGTDTIYIKRWNIENYILKERDNYAFTASASHKFSSEAMTVEHYHIRFHSTAAKNSTVLSMYQPKTFQSDFDLIDKLESSHILSLGPNSNGQREDVVVSSVSLGAVGQERVYNVYINGQTTYAYDGPNPTATGIGDTYDDRYGSPASFYHKIWFFNNYDGTDDTSGRLYSSSAYTEMGNLQWYPGGEYKNVKACTFYDVPNYIFDRDWQATEADDAHNWPKFHSLIYVRTTNAIFLNVEDFNNSFGSMTMDNIKDTQDDTIAIYDLAINGVNVYRLQTQATYYGNTYTFDQGNYSYQLSTLEPFITSISLRSDPAILPANNTNTAVITAIVKDQFDLPIEGKDVYFTDDDPVGNITGRNPAKTLADGTATTKYTAGSSAREVKITATAQQGGVESPTD